MRYRIDYMSGERSTFVNNRTELIERLRLLDRDAVEDVRKLYKSGVSDSVRDSYRQFIR